MAPSNKLVDAMSDIEVTVTSPDRCIQVTVHRGGIEIELSRDSFEKHSPASLSTAVNKAISAAGDGFGQVVRQANSQIREEWDD
ncbi:MAG: hypothetical protein ACRDTU_20365 [Micromonosporaceae bacterium]